MDKHHATAEPPDYPLPLPRSSTFVQWGGHYAIVHAAEATGWRFTVHEWTGTAWVPWFHILHSHFGSGWAQARNRVRRLLLEGERPERVAADPELASLYGYWAEHGKHALARDNQQLWDAYGLDQT